jgi:anti-anti-sigma regulatory factor
MRCETCLFEHPDGASLPLPEFLDRLAGCDGCPHVRGEAASPLVQLLVRRQREAATALRRAGNRARKAEAALAELGREVDRYESRLAVLEELQKTAVLETAADLKAQAETIARKEAELLAVSTPIIAVWDDVVVVPVIGRLDELRAERLRTALLAEVHRSAAKHAILDLTGALGLGEAACEHLLRVTRAVRLLGADVTLTGIGPEAARSLVTSGGDLAGLRTTRTLREALRLFVRAG